MVCSGDHQEFQKELASIRERVAKLETKVTMGLWTNPVISTILTGLIMYVLLGEKKIWN